MATQNLTRKWTLGRMWLNVQESRIHRLRKADFVHSNMTPARLRKRQQRYRKNKVLPY